MKKYSDLYKQLCLDNGDYQYYCSLVYRALEDGVQVTNLVTMWQGRDMKSWDCCRCIYNAYHQRSLRLRKKIKSLLVSGAYFLTLTFTDFVLDNVSPVTRRRYVHYWLKKNFECYVANKDFGADFNREHYHAIVSHLKNDGCLFLDRDSEGRVHSSSDWPYGFSNWEKCGDGHGDNVKLAKYVSKLQLHALKKTASTERMIFSRNV